MNKLFLYYNTLRHLKAKQFLYRLPLVRKWYCKPSTAAWDKELAGAVTGFIPSLFSASTFQQPGSFTFLNHTHNFGHLIDWKFKDHSILWTYNLNYFEYLEQPGMDAMTGITLINRFLEQYDTLNTGREPYPISLRLIYWIRFFMRHNIRPEAKYLDSLHQQAKELQQKIELHLLGNHLLENAFALFFTACYLGDRSMLTSARELVQSELKEQILKDGGHFELSPMYHNIILYRLLDVVNMARSCGIDLATAALPFLEEKAKQMLSWMKRMTFSDGTFPLLNDAAYGIAPEAAQLLAYAEKLQLSCAGLELNESGYRKWKTEDWELLIDAGKPGPDYIPGHAHCDMLSFVLHVSGKPVIVDTGTSVYGDNPSVRKKEKATTAHNTVQIADLEQSQIWGDFRMARRGNIRIRKENNRELEAAHTGFFFGKESHARCFSADERNICITDKVLLQKEKMENKAFFHFHPDIDPLVVNDEVCFPEGKMRFTGHSGLTVEHYDYAPEFGKRVPAKVLKVLFSNNLTTVIEVEKTNHPLA